MITPFGRHLEIVTINCNKSTNVKKKKASTIFVKMLRYDGKTGSAALQKGRCVRVSAFCCTGTG